jgi:YhhN family
MFAAIKKIFSYSRVHKTLIALFFIFLALECYFLYDRQYTHRLYSRTFLMPLLIMAYMLHVVSRVHLLLLAALLMSWAGDCLTIQFSVKLQWLGLLGYAISFILYALAFKRLHPFSLPSGLIPLAIGLIGAGVYIYLIQFFGKNRILLMDKARMFAYAGVLVYFVTLGLNTALFNKKYGFKFLFISLFLLVAANLLFESSIYVFHRTKTYIDVITAACYGVFHILTISKIMAIEQQIMIEEDMKELYE